MISFDSIHETLATFAAGSGLQAGQVCKVTANGTVGPCSNGDVFCGVAGRIRKGSAAVQMGGYVELPYTGTKPSFGYVTLAANAAGGVKTAENGRTCLVVKTDAEAGIVGLFL